MPINTTRSWARVIRRYEDVPECYRGHFAAFSVECMVPPYTVFAPPDRSFGKKQNPRIICAADDEIRIYERYRKQLTCTAFPIRDIQYVETGAVLLYSWIKICGMIDGKPCCAAWTYNTSTEPIFKSIVDRARGLKTASGMDTQAFSFLLPLGYKYANMAKGAIAPGEEALKVLVQPEKREARFTIFHKTFYRTVLPSAVIIATRRELILLHTNADNTVKAGGIKRFIPLDKVSDASIAADGKRMRCILYLQEGERVTIDVESSKREDLAAMIDAFRRV